MLDSDYLGSKIMAAPLIIGHMPYHITYKEGFLGSGQIMKRKPLSPVMIGYEKDRSVIDRFDYPAAAQIVNGCAIEAIEREPSGDDVLWYFDPPYHPDTRTSNHGYNCELDHKDHERLLRALNRADCPVMLSGYNNPLYDRELRKWRRVDYEAMTRGGVRIESLWMNFPQAKPYWHTQVGRDFTDRQRIKRLCERRAAQYEKMSAGERLALRAALCAVDAQAAQSRPT